MKYFLVDSYFNWVMLPQYQLQQQNNNSLMSFSKKNENAIDPSPLCSPIQNSSHRPISEKSPAKRRVRIKSIAGSEEKKKQVLAELKDSFNKKNSTSFGRERVKTQKEDTAYFADPQLNEYTTKTDSNQTENVVSQPTSNSPQDSKHSRKNDKLIILKPNAKNAPKNGCRKQAQEVDRLLEITSRCVDYYNKFMEEKEMETKVVREAFQEISESLNLAFSGIINEVQSKFDEITHFLHKKESELLHVKQEQENILRNCLESIKEIHLTNILTNEDSSPLFSHSKKKSFETEDSSDEVCHYARILHEFYEGMEVIERNNFKENVDETINFINNLITEELKFIVYDRIPQKSANCSFSFNDGMGIATSRADPSIVSSTFEFEEKKLFNLNMENALGKKGKEMEDAWCQTIPCTSRNALSPLESIKKMGKFQKELTEKLQRYSKIL